MNQPSIPETLHNALVTRWLAGSSPAALLRWIEETNATRQTPVETSRTSIQRLMIRIAQSDASACQLQAVHRARMTAPAALDAIEDTVEGYRECERASATVNDRTDEVRIKLRLQALLRTELALHRQARIAGITGRAAERLVEKHQAVLQEWGADIAAQDAREDAGIPPETGARPLPVSLLSPTEVAAEVPASIHLVSQPIPQAKRAGEDRLIQPEPMPRRNVVRHRLPPTDIPADIIAAACSRPAHRPPAVQ